MTRQQKQAEAVKALRRASQALNLEATSLEVIKFPTEADMAKSARSASAVADQVLEIVERMEAP